jgi:hypothetical protein
VPPRLKAVALALVIDFSPQGGGLSVPIGARHTTAESPVLVDKAVGGPLFQTGPLHRASRGSWGIQGRHIALLPCSERLSS